MLEVLKEFITRNNPSDLELNYKGYQIWNNLKDRAEINAKDIQWVQSQHGYDAANWILYKTFKERPSFKKFSEFAEKNRGFYSKDNKEVVVVVLEHNPWRSANFNQEYQWKMKNVAADSGFEFCYPEISWRRSIFPNAYYYQDILKRFAGRDVILMSHSQASLETRWLLERSQQLNVNILGWLNISGMLYGTALPKTGKDLWHRFKKIMNDEYPVTPEIARANAYCYADFKFKLPMVSVLGFQPRKYFSLPESHRDRELSHWGPHDGIVSHIDYMKNPGVVWPIWGESHSIDLPTYQKSLQAALKWLIVQARGG